MTKGITKVILKHLKYKYRITAKGVGNVRSVVRLMFFYFISKLNSNWEKIRYAYKCISVYCSANFYLFIAPVAHLAMYLFNNMF